MMAQGDTAPGTCLTGSVRVLALALLLLAAAPAAAAADVRLDGQGFGHGVGLSQYGAYGYALREARTARFIVGHYFTGTTVQTRPATAIRVRLKAGSSAKVCSARTATGAQGRVVTLREDRAYRLNPVSTAQLAVVDSTTGATLATIGAPVTVADGSDGVCLRGVAENGVDGGSYRGTFVVMRDGAGVLVVNRVSLEHYVYGVVPSEMPASWPHAALKAQAIAARSYALRSLRPAAAYDVFADTRSQVYRGMVAETAATTFAVQDSQAQAVMAGAEVAQTFFFSTSGGVTENNEAAIGGAPISYLRSVADPHDDLSPSHRWTVTFTTAQLDAKLGDLVAGQATGLQVLTRTATGRAATVRIVGTEGTNTVPATTIRTRLGLRSVWFFVA